MKEKEKNNKEIEREGGERGNPYEAALLEDVPFSAFHPSRSLQLPRTNADGCDWTRGLGSALPPFFLPIALPLLHLHTHTRGRALLGSWCILAPAETAIAFRRPFFSHYILSSPSGVFVRYIALPISSIRLSNFFIFYLCTRFQLSPPPLHTPQPLHTQDTRPPCQRQSTQQIKRGVIAKRTLFPSVAQYIKKKTVSENLHVKKKNKKKKNRR